MRLKKFNQRIAGLEASMARDASFAVKVVERVNLPESDKQILRRALRNTIVVVSHNELAHLNAVINALPVVERDRVNRATEAALIIGISEADAGV